MSGLTRDLVLRPRERRYQDVPVPELATPEDPNPTARLQALNAGELDRFLNSLHGPDGKYNRQDYAAKIVVVSWVAPTGERLFGDDDLAVVSLIDGAVIQRLAIEAEKLCGLQAKQVEQAAGN